MSYSKAVYEFSNAVAESKGTPLPTTPTLMTPEACDFIKQMVEDEMNELAVAEDVAEQADALVDAIYYICDTAAKHGMNLDKLFDIVHGANMNKLVDGKAIICQEGERKGKVEKPEGWKPADEEFNAEIKRQQEEGSW
jgi:predicted HAD superfamily Cof-like phosphohydrolase